MTELKLKGKQSRYLRGLGHHLQPIVMLGKDELSDQVVSATDAALEKHELIKVRLQEGCALDRKAAAAELARLTSSAVAQILGKTFLLYRRGKKPEINLPS
jgi:RNA-binding protein